MALMAECHSNDDLRKRLDFGDIWILYVFRDRVSYCYWKGQIQSMKKLISSFFKKRVSNISAFNHMYICVQVWLWRPEESIGFPELNWQVDVYYLMWVLGTEIRSLGRAVDALNHWTLSPAPKKCILWVDCNPIWLSFTERMKLPFNLLWKGGWTFHRVLLGTSVVLSMSFM